MRRGCVRCVNRVYRRSEFTTVASPATRAEHSSGQCAHAPVGKPRFCLLNDFVACFHLVDIMNNNTV